MQEALDVNEVFQRAAEKPLGFLKLSAESEKNGGRSAALVLTKEDIKRIKRYERAAKGLPSSPSAVTAHLGGSISHIPGLEPSALLAVYEGIRLHGTSWWYIEKDIKNVGSSLATFSKNTFDTAAVLFNIVSDMSPSKQIGLAIDKLQEADLADIPSLVLDDTDRLLLKMIPQYLSLLKADVEKFGRQAASLTSLIINFSKQISSDLIPQVGQKLKISKRHGVSELLKVLREEIAELDKKIEQKKAEYTNTVNDIAFGILGGPLGILIAGGYLGSIAESIRKEKNRFIETRDEKVRELKRNEPIEAALEELNGIFMDMNDRLIDAEKSSQNLEDLWSLISVLIDRSMDEISKIDDSEKLFLFYIKFKRAIRPWEEIKDYSQELMRLFNDAVEEMNKENAALDLEVKQ